MGNLMSSNSKKTWLCGSISMLECYDFGLALSLAPILSKVFYTNTPTLSLIVYYIIIMIGYFSRPIGAIVIGFFGDKYGRKKTYIANTFIMLIATIMLVFTPSSQSIGALAVFIFLLIRMIQGFSFGGEVGGGLTLCYEYGIPKYSLKFCAIFEALTSAGTILVTSIIAILVYSISPQSMIDYGWRIAFAFGAVLTFISYLLRFKLTETFHPKSQKHTPIYDLFLNYKKRLTLAILLSLVTVSITITGVFLPIILLKITSLTFKDVSYLHIYSSVALLISSLLVATFFPQRFFAKSWLIAVFIQIIFSILLFTVGLHFNLEVWMIIAGIINGLISTLTIGYIPSIFPKNIRYTATSLSFSIAIIIIMLLNLFILYTTHYVHMMPIIVLCVILISGVTFTYSGVISRDLKNS